MYVDILKKQSESGVQFDTLEIGVTGGALMSPQLFSDVRKNFGLSSIKVYNFLYFSYYFFLH